MCRCVGVHSTAASLQRGTILESVLGGLLCLAWPMAWGDRLSMLREGRVVSRAAKDREPMAFVSFGNFVLVGVR